MNITLGLGIALAITLAIGSAVGYGMYQKIEAQQSAYKKLEADRDAEKTRADDAEKRAKDLTVAIAARDAKIASVRAATRSAQRQLQEIKDACLDSPVPPELDRLLRAAFPPGSGAATTEPGAGAAPVPAVGRQDAP